MIPGILGSMLLGGVSHRPIFFFAGSQCSLMGTLPNGGGIATPPAFSTPMTFATSDDGINWTARTIPYQGIINRRVVWGNNVYVTKGLDSNGLVLLYSQDGGATWNRSSSKPYQGVLETSSETNYIDKGEVAYGNGRFVALGSNFPTPFGSGQTSYSPVVAMSLDGITWTSGVIPLTYGLGMSVVFARGKFIASVQDLSGGYTWKACRCYTSIDGLNWTDMGPMPWANPSQSAGGNFVLGVGPNGRVVGGSIGLQYNLAVVYSDDAGQTWKSASNLPSPWNRFINDIQYANGRYYFLGATQTTYSQGAVASSADLVSWTMTNFSPLGYDQVMGLGFNPRNGRWVMGGETAGNGPAGPQVVAGSTDGVNFTRETATNINPAGTCYGINFV